MHKQDTRKSSMASIKTKGLGSGAPTGGGYQGEGDVMLPAIDLGMAVTIARAVNDVCDDVLDKLYEVTEKDCQAALDKTLKKSAALIKNLSDKLVEHQDQACESYVKLQAQQYAIKRIPEGANRLPDGEWWSIEDETDEYGEGYRDLESGEGGVVLSKVTMAQDEAYAKKFRDHHSGMVGLLNDVEAACLDFTEEEMEELADVGLFCARIAAEYAQGFARRSLAILEKDYDWETAEEKRREREEHVTVEEATEEEIAELYRSRMEEPLPPFKTNTVKSGSKRSKTTTTSTHVKETKNSFFDDLCDPYALAPPPSSGRCRRGRGAPSRLLWQPVGPSLLQALLSTPQQFQSHPFKTTGLYAALLPVSGIIVFCLPGVLITDAVLQAMYKKVGHGVEVWIHDGKEICRLSWMVSRLSLRQTYRLANKQLRKTGADPMAALNWIGEMACEAVVHPLVTAGVVWERAKRAVVTAGKIVEWAQKQVMEK